MERRVQVKVDLSRLLLRAWQVDRALGEGKSLDEAIQEASALERFIFHDPSGEQAQIEVVPGDINIKSLSQDSSVQADTDEPRPLRRWTPDQDEQLRQLVDQGLTDAEIGATMDRTRHAVLIRRRTLGISKTPGRPKGSSAGRKSLSRFPHPKATRARTVLADHPASSEARTLFPTTVVDVKDSPRVLVSGVNNPKIGRSVRKGPWSGYPIYTLTLEERATCPRSCHHWQDCYGNNMHMARRHRHGPELEQQINDELAVLQGQHPLGFVVRLHVLGDFYSVEYVEKWGKWLGKFPALRVYGYTAHPESSPTGAAIHRLRSQSWSRFAIRTSQHYPGPMTAITRKKTDSDAKDAGIFCPAQSSATECCGTCGLCWAEEAREKTIIFQPHGEVEAVDAA